MNLIDPLCITAVGALAGALARRFVPRAMPRYLSQVVALGAVGAWAGVVLASWLMASGTPWGVAGGTAWACALLGAAIVLDGYHLLLRRQLCRPSEGVWVHRKPAATAISQALPLFRSARTLDGSVSAAAAPEFGPRGAKVAVMRFGTAWGVCPEGQASAQDAFHTAQQMATPGMSQPAQQTAPKTQVTRRPNRASSFALERKLARKRRLLRTRAVSRARGQAALLRLGRRAT